MYLVGQEKKQDYLQDSRRRMCKVRRRKERVEIGLQNYAKKAG